jgi:hypothetical protein
MRLLVTSPVKESSSLSKREELAFIVVFVIDSELEVGSVSKAILADDFSFQLKDGDTGAIKGHPGGLLLRLEFKVNGGRHGHWTKECER